LKWEVRSGKLEVGSQKKLPSAICFSPDGSGKLFLPKSLFFLNKKERPEEAPFLFL
jgi:hypothetical protein